MAPNGVHRIRADQSKNRLFVILQGELTEAQILEAVDQIIACVGKLEPGFSVVTDTATFKAATAKGAQDIQQVEGFVARSGVGRVVRVVDASGRSALQFVRAGRAIGHLADTAASVVAAEALLDPLPA